MTPCKLDVKEYNNSLLVLRCRFKGCFSLLFIENICENRKQNFEVTLHYLPPNGTGKHRGYFKLTSIMLLYVFFIIPYAGNLFLKIKIDPITIYYC